jgi:hypothetical protein
MNKEKPGNNPGKRTDEKNTKQTDEPLEGPKNSGGGRAQARSGEVARYQYSLREQDDGG